MPRPKCTAEAVKKAERMKRKGYFDKDIAAAIGVRSETFSTWINHPKSENQHKLSKVLKKAEGDYLAALEEKIANAADKDWKAAAWLLERKHPMQYSLAPARFIDDSREGTNEIDALTKALMDIGGKL